MQIKTMDGVMRLISATLLENAYKTWHAKDHNLVEEILLDQFIKRMSKYACLYKEKAEHNIKRIALLETLPTTEDDVKTAVLKVIRHGNPEELADILYEADLFLGARFIKHLMSKFME